MATAANNALRRAAAIGALEAMPGGTISDEVKLRLKRSQTIDLELLELIVALLQSINARIPA